MNTCELAFFALIGTAVLAAFYVVIRGGTE